MGPLAARRGLDVNVRSGPQAREYEAIVERIRRDAPRSILDWGCGFGQVTQLMRRAGLDVTAFDYRPGPGTDGPQPLQRYPDLRVHLSSDPVALPFADASFEAVLSCGVLEHVLHPDASLEEIKRVLAPGGTFYVFKLPNRYSYLEHLARGMGLYYHGAEPLDAVYTRRSARALLRRHGFQVKEVQLANMLPLTLPGRPAARAAGAIWAANRILGRVPGLNLLATNLELVATPRP